MFQLVHVNGNGDGERHPDVDPVPVDPAYYQASYNIARCGICGVSWEEHPKTIYCNRYRPPDGLITSLPEHTVLVIERNDKTKSK